MHARPSERRDIFPGQVVRVGFNGCLTDIKRIPGQCEGFLQFVDQDGRRAAADINPPEIISAFLIDPDFPSKRTEVIPAERLVKNDPVEGAVGAQLFAERDVKVKQAGLFSGRRLDPGSGAFFEFHGPCEFAPRRPCNDPVDQRVTQTKFFA